MTELLNSWGFNMVGALAATVALDQLYKLFARTVRNEAAAFVLINLIGGITVLFFVPYFDFKFPTQPIYYILPIISFVFYAIADRIQPTVRKHLEVSIVSILLQLTSVFVFIYGVILYHEALTISKVVGILLVISATILVLYRRGTFVANKYTLLTFIAAITGATGFAIDIGNSAHFNMPLYFSMAYFLPIVFVALFEKITVKQIVREYRRIDTKYLLLTGIMWGLAGFFGVHANQLGSVTTTESLLATTVFFSVILAYFVQGERRDELKKIVAALIVIVGIILTVR